MTTTVTYHSDGYAAARPAINVKCRTAGADCWPPAGIFPEAGTPGENDQDYDALVGTAYERVQSDFWQAASEIATQRGLGEITQEGRSGGWLVLTDPPFTHEEYPDVPCEEWLAAYTALHDWCDREVAAAPDRVKALAHQYGMDRVGYPAARRMFGEGYG